MHVSISCLGNVSAHHFKPDDTLMYYQKAVKIFSKFPDKITELGAVYNNIAYVHSTQNNFESALEYYKKDLDISRDSLGNEHPSVGTSYNNIAMTLVSMGNFDKAMENIQRAIDIKEKALGNDSPSVATSYECYASILEKTMQTSKALEIYNNALSIKERSLGRHHPDVGSLLLTVADLCTILEDYEKVISCYEKALPIYLKNRGGYDPSCAEIIRRLSDIYSRRNGPGDEEKVNEYKELYEKLISMVDPGDENASSGAGGESDEESEWETVSDSSAGSS